MSLSLLSLLVDGEYHSGQQLADQLGLSRTAVWKQIESLTGLGARIETQRGKGYRWLGASPLLDQALLNQRLQALGSPCRCEVVDAISSTNQTLLSRVAELDTGFSLVAESQSGGRGRRGRVWHSPVAENLYVSTLLRVQAGASVLQGLSLVVGISLAETLNELLGLGVRLKWPNDLLVEGKKLGGILVELQGDIAGDCAAVIGFGLNVNMSAVDGDDINQPWVALCQLSGQSVCRNHILPPLLDRLHKDLALLQQQGIVAFSRRWKALDAFTGKSVAMVQGSTMVEGEYLGIDAQGALIVEVDGEPVAFHGGEVSLRCR